jgi:V-type H+-transporting ATPase subunit C
MDSGNLSVKSLIDVVSNEHFIQDSEYLETLLVAVAKYAFHPYQHCQLTTTLKGLKRKNGVQSMND